MLFLRILVFSSQKFFRNAYFRILIGSLVFIYSHTSTRAFTGIGDALLQTALRTPETIPHFSFLLKIIATALTFAIGFRGGEVTPLFIMGACLGAEFFQIFPLAGLATLGMIGAFAGGTKAPTTAIILAAELFGIQTALWSIPVVWIANKISGKRSLFSE